MKKPLLLFLLFLSIAFSTLYIFSNSNNNYRKASSILEISYGEYPLQKYDIYLPKYRSTKKTKVIIFIHGGGWTKGDKSNIINLISILQSLNPNYAFVNMNYSLANETNFAFPNQFYDIDLLLNHLTAKRNDYKINPSFALIGRSAGGHLALMYDYAYDHQDRVKMVCSLAGPTDFTNPFFKDNPNFELSLKMLVNPDKYDQEGSKLTQILSPASRVTRNSSPTLIFHGINDMTVPFENSKILSDNLDLKTVPNRLFKFNEGHGSWSQETMNTVELELHLFIENYFSI